MTHHPKTAGADGVGEIAVLEFRPREDGSFDEIVARFADGMVHVETMSDKSCYVGFYWDDGRYCQWWISSRKRLEYHHEDGMSEPPRFTAQAIEARRAETGTGSVEDESAVGSADAAEPQDHPGDNHD